MAIAYENHEILKLLVKAKGINFEPKGESGFTPVAYAIEFDVSIEILSILLNAYNDGWERALVCTLRYLEVNHGKKLYNYIINNAKIKFDYLDDEGNNFLHLIANETSYLFPSIFLKKCTLNQQNKQGKTPLHCVVIKNRLSRVKQLLEKEDIDVNIPDEKGRTALHYAIIKSYTEITNLLLGKKEININAQDGEGSTALHLSVKSHLFRVRVLIVKSLLSDPRIIVNLRDKKNKVPLDYERVHVNDPTPLALYSLKALLAPYMESPHVVNSMFQHNIEEEKAEHFQALKYYVTVYTILVEEPPAYIPQNILQSLKEDPGSEKSPLYKK